MNMSWEVNITECYEFLTLANQLHALVTLTLVPSGWEAGLVPELVWTPSIHPSTYSATASFGPWPPSKRTYIFSILNTSPPTLYSWYV